MRPRILYVQYTDPSAYPPLEHSARLLADAGWEVLFLGAAAPDTAGLRLRPHPRVALRRLPYCPAGWRQKAHYAWFALWALGWALRWRPRWVYASDHLACPVALLLSLLPGVRVVYHEHDAPVPPPGGAVSAFTRGCLAARRRLAARAAVCVLPNAERARRFAREVGRAAGEGVLCVWNCPAAAELGPPRAPRPPPAAPPGDAGDAGDAGDTGKEPPLWVLYHGSVVPARLPPAVLEALARLPEAVRLRVVGYETVGAGGYVGELRALARRLGVAHRVHFVNRVSRDDLMAQCRECDVGLSLVDPEVTDDNLRFLVGASNKPFDYLACGLALLVPDLPDWRRLYVAPGYGLACDPGDPGSIAAALGWFLAHPGELRAMGERGRRRIAAEWHYEARFAPVLARLTGSAGGQPGR
ncbi:MAG TPA: glycosyltransferase [Chloroflexota bacterium]|nr:glycosyltransferase [Chloroflexota bacterium]